MNKYFNPDPKKKTWRSKEYLEFIENKDCSGCDKEKAPSVPHHESLKNTGFAMKCPDYQTIPLGGICHTLEHGGNGMDKIEKLEIMIRCMGEWIESHD